MANIFTKSFDLLNASLDRRISDLQKAEPSPTEQLLMKAQKDDGIGRKGLIFDPFQDQNQYAGGLYKMKASFLSPLVLKQVSRRDPIVASAIDLRASQVMTACKKQGNRFDLGFRINPKNKEVQPDADEVRKLEEYILNCGEKKDRSEEDKITFDQWGYMVARDFMIYGYTAVELIPTAGKGLYAFLPLPGESIYYANKKVKPEMVKQMRDMWRQGVDESKVSIDRAANGEYEYVQVIDGKVVEAFSRDELIFERLNMESDIDLNGYAVGPLERAISAITSHMQIDNHQKSFFTHGVASKGLLVIQGDITPNQLRALQAQWTQQVTGPLNAWRTPILAGIEGVQWTPLVMNSRDMEYAAYQDYILRVIFSCFAIDPEEVGFGYLSKGVEQKSMSESSNEWKITASRDRGLRPILGRIEAIINEKILPKYSKDLSEKYHFCFVGLDAETEMEEVQRLQAETALTKTIDEARKEQEMDPMEFGGKLIMNALLLQTLQSNMYKGQFMESFLGVQGASQNPDLQYIPDPLWFQWQQMMQQMMQQQAMAEQAAEGDEDGEGEEGDDPDGSGDNQGPPGDSGDGAGKDDSGKDKDSGAKGGKKQGPPGQPGQPEQDPEMQAQLAQAQGAAVEQYIAANPHLFKTLKKNIENLKAEVLSKSDKGKSKKIRDEHVEKARDALVEDFRKGSEGLIKEIMEAIRDEVAERGGDDGKN